MDYVEAPHPFQHAPRPFVFFAGGITGCPDWQQQLRELLQEQDVRGTILNPRRANFPIGDSTVAQQQISWEFWALRQADVISFWFAKETINPISLFELGSALERVVWRRHDVEATSAPQQLVLGVEPGYARAQDVRLQSRLVLPSDPPPYMESLSEVAATLVTVCGAFER